MTRILPFLGSEQLEVMSVVASFLLLCVQCTTSVCVKERVLLSSMWVFIFVKDLSRLRAGGAAIAAKTKAGSYGRCN
jgi:hypothetical protein